MADRGTIPGEIEEFQAKMTRWGFESVVVVFTSVDPGFHLYNISPEVNDDALWVALSDIKRAWPKRGNCDTESD